MDVDFRVDPGSVTEVLRAGSISDIEKIGGNVTFPPEEVWVADRTAAQPGIRILRFRDGVELTPVPIDVGMPPSKIGFLE